MSQHKHTINDQQNNFLPHGTGLHTNPIVESRFLQKTNKSPETGSTSAETAKEGAEQGTGTETITKNRADTSEKVDGLVGDNIRQEESPKIVPDRPESKKREPLSRHFTNMKNSLPTVGDVAITGAAVPGALVTTVGGAAYLAGYPLINIYQRLRGVPKEQRMGPLDPLKMGLKSVGKVASTPFKLAKHTAHLGYEAAGRTLDTVVGGPLRWINNKLTFRGKEGQKRHLLKRALLGTGEFIKDVAYTPIHIIRQIPKIIQGATNDLDKHMLATGVGVTLIAGTIAALATNPAGFGAATGIALAGAGNFFGGIGNALGGLFGKVPIPGLTP